VFTVVRYRSLADVLSLLTGSAFRSYGAAPLPRSTRMAQREHRRPPNQVRAPQARPVRTRRRPSAPPALLLALALSSMGDTARTQSPSRDGPRRVGRRVYTERSGVRQWLGEGNIPRCGGRSTVCSFFFSSYPICFLSFRLHHFCFFFN
jgi:hypothetical protein